MPLSKKRMRERKRLDRVKPMSNLTTITPVKPSEPKQFVKPKLRTYSKEDQVKTFGILKKQFDYRS